MTRHRFVDDTPTTVVCVAKHQTDPDRPRTATRGLLCTGHYADLEQLLAELPALLGEVARALPTGSGGMGPKVTGNPERALPFNPHISDALHDAEAVLAAWSMQILDTHPNNPHPPAAAHLSPFLLRHLEWASGEQWIAELLDEMRSLRARLRASLTVSRTRKAPLGPCERVYACDVTSHAELICDGILQARVPVVDDAGPGVITCPVCGASYEPADWRAVARRLRKGAESWLTYAQLSQLFVVPIGTLKDWAQRDKWRRIGSRPMKFHLDDAQQTFESRRMKETA